MLRVTAARVRTISPGRLADGQVGVPLPHPGLVGQLLVQRGHRPQRLRRQRPGRGQHRQLAAAGGDDPAGDEDEVPEVDVGLPGAPATPRPPRPGQHHLQPDAGVAQRQALLERGEAELAGVADEHHAAGDRRRRRRSPPRSPGGPSARGPRAARGSAAPSPGRARGPRASSRARLSLRTRICSGIVHRCGRTRLFGHRVSLVPRAPGLVAVTTRTTTPGSPRGLAGSRP